MLLPRLLEFGSCVDIAAPGIGIKSAMNTGTTATATWQGTSMAAPHVTGVVAQILQHHPTYTPAQVQSVLTLNAKQGGVAVPAGLSLSNNFLLQTHLGDCDQCSNSGDCTSPECPSGHVCDEESNQCVNDSPPEPCGGPCPPGLVCDEGSNTCVDASPPPSECTPGTGGRNDACSVNEDCSSCNCNTNNNKCSGN